MAKVCRRDSVSRPPAPSLAPAYSHEELGTASDLQADLALALMSAHRRHVRQCLNLARSHIRHAQPKTGYTDLACACTTNAFQRLFAQKNIFAAQTQIGRQIAVKRLQTQAFRLCANANFLCVNRANSHHSCHLMATYCKEVAKRRPPSPKYRSNLVPVKCHP